jgi:hypothetical protein
MTRAANGQFVQAARKGFPGHGNARADRQSAMRKSTNKAGNDSATMAPFLQESDRLYCFVHRGGAAR